MKTWHTIRGGAAGLAAVAAAIVVTGCGSGTTSSSSTTAPATPGTPAASGTTASASPTGATPTGAASAPGSGPTTSASAPAGSTANAVTPGGAPTCTTAGLKLSLGQAEGAAGSVYQNIDFTNTTAQPCTMYGYPGVSLLGGTPLAQIGAAAERSQQTPPKLVTLQAGGTATALLRVTQANNYPTSMCDPVSATTLLVYPPNQKASLQVHYTALGCKSATVKLLEIGVVQPGSGG